jgi:hypothetical protein
MNREVKIAEDARDIGTLGIVGLVLTEARRSRGAA